MEFFNEARQAERDMAEDSRQLARGVLTTAALLSRIGRERADRQRREADRQTRQLKDARPGPDDDRRPGEVAAETLARNRRERAAHRPDETIDDTLTVRRSERAAGRPGELNLETLLRERRNRADPQRPGGPRAAAHTAVSDPQRREQRVEADLSR